ncbi:MAG TPA: hypothetical protein PL185_02520 [Flavobacteriales bacterium]|nr:hypothetical protein [Flavobacteriales bacterium]
MIDIDKWMVEIPAGEIVYSTIRFNRMKIIYSFFVLIACLVCGCSYSAGPKNHYYKKNGQIWNTSKIYGYPNGKRTLAQIDTYKKQNNSKESSTYDLQESVLFYELWPNYEWKFVSKKGFTTYKSGKYLLNNDSLVVPDNVIYKYFDKDFIEHIEVYKDRKRIPYTAGYPDGHRSMQYLREQPGVYNWKDGKEYFERPFTEAEWGSHEKMNEYLNRKSASDTIKIK